MNNDIIFGLCGTAIGAVFSAGAFMSTTNFRIKKLELQIESNSKISERLAVLEEQIKTLINRKLV